jgi:hypothetical protein
MDEVAQYRTRRRRVNRDRGADLHGARRCAILGRNQHRPFPAWLCGPVKTRLSTETVDIFICAIRRRGYG